MKSQIEIAAVFRQLNLKKHSFDRPGKHLGYTCRGCSDSSSRTAQFDWLNNKLGYSQTEDWHKVTGENIHRYGGADIPETYNQSISSTALESIYPQHNGELDNKKKEWKTEYS